MRLFQQRHAPNVNSVWLWFQFQKDLIDGTLGVVRAKFAAGVPLAGNSRLVGKTWPEVREFFEEQHGQLELMAMLELLTTTEAILRLEFNLRVKGRKKDTLSRQFREIHKVALNSARAQPNGRLKVRLEADILGTMAEKGIRVSEFRAALKLRNWLAHGRYWLPRLGRVYTPEEIFDISEALVNSIPA